MAPRLLVMLVGTLLCAAMLPPPGAAAGGPGPSPGERVRARTKPGTPIELKPEPVEATLEPEGAAAPGVAEAVKALKPGGSLHVVLLGLGADAPPGTLYGVYLDLPPNATREQKRAHAVGSINFFNFAGRPAEAPGDAAGRRSVSLDATEVARKLQAQGKLRAKPVVTILPVGRPEPNARPVVGEIRLVES